MLILNTLRENNAQISDNILTSFLRSFKHFAQIISLESINLGM